MGVLHLCGCTQHMLHSSPGSTTQSRLQCVLRPSEEREHWQCRHDRSKVTRQARWITHVTGISGGDDMHGHTIAKITRKGLPLTEAGTGWTRPLCSQWRPQPLCQSGCRMQHSENPQLSLLEAGSHWPYTGRRSAGGQLKMAPRSCHVLGNLQRCLAHTWHRWHGPAHTPEWPWGCCWWPGQQPLQGHWQPQVPPPALPLQQPAALQARGQTGQTGQHRAQRHSWRHKAAGRLPETRWWFSEGRGSHQAWGWKGPH